MNIRTLILTVSLSAALHAAAADLHITPNGSDANSGLGLEPAAALRTIQAAVNTLILPSVVLAADNVTPSKVPKPIPIIDVSRAAR